MERDIGVASIGAAAGGAAAGERSVLLLNVWLWPPVPSMPPMGRLIKTRPPSELSGAHVAWRWWLGPPPKLSGPWSLAEAEGSLWWWWWPADEDECASDEGPEKSSGCWCCSSLASASPPSPASKLSPSAAGVVGCCCRQMLPPLPGTAVVGVEGVPCGDVTIGVAVRLWAPTAPIPIPALGGCWPQRFVRNELICA